MSGSIAGGLARVKPHVAYVDGLRAIAVLSVIAFHAAKADDAHFPNWAYCGSRGVVLFFVISGFCLAFPFLAALRSGGTFVLGSALIGRFLVRRFSRIAPPFYAALIFFLLLGITPFGFPDAGHQDTSWPNIFHDFFADVMFETSKQPLLNISFWTLGIEARWYLMCPLLIALYVRSRIAFAALGTALYGMYLFTPYSIADMGTFPAFMTGILAADIVLSDRAWRHRAWIPAILALAAATFEQSRTPVNDLGDPLWTAACFFFVVAGSSGLPARALSWKPLAYVGIASYSIYLVHEPFIVAFVRSGVPRPVAALLGLTIGLSAYLIVERPLATKASRAAIEAAIAWPLRALAKRTVAVESEA